MERKNAWNFYHEEDLAAVEELSILYRRFLDAGKTERECAAEAVRMAQEAGYQDLLQMVHEGETLCPGDKVYLSFMKKSAAFFWIGTDPLEEGMNIIGAHIDSPRLDLKQVPCYEEAGNVYLDTHYYGGIKNTSGLRFLWRCTGSSSERTGHLSACPWARRKTIRCS